MKKYIFTILVISAVALISGCTDELENQFTAKHPGEEIVFGGRATYELDESRNKAPQTRTVYTGTFLGADGNAWESGTKYEVIHWVSGDKVRIFSAEAAGTTVADYSVNVNDTDATGETELSKVSGVGLQWSDKTSYDFYAVYPSPHQYPLKDNQLDPAVDAAVLNNGMTILGRIPAVQECKGTPVKSGTAWTLSPKMEYAYMVAHQKVENANKTGAEIYLNFVPIATAVEVELVNKSNRALELANILVSSATDGTALTGDFTADLSKLTVGTEKNIYTGIPEDGFITNVSNTGTQISIPTYQGEGGLTGDPIALANDEGLKFTLFMLPNQDVDDLKITLVGIDGNRVGTTTGITITKHKKTFLNQMPISGKSGDYDQSRWIEFLPDNAYLKGLSIPGAGGASSGNVYADASATVKDYLEQSLSIENLWKQGIRCFEFTVDVDNSTSGTKDLGGVEVYCNAQETNLTLDDCITKVKTLLGQYPDEFAMVIITYQQSTGWNVRNQTTGLVTQSRDPKVFMTQLNDYWGNLEMPTGTQKALYNGALTVDEARGSLFCIARPTSNGEDNYAVVNGGSSASDQLTKTTYPTSIATPVVSDPTILVIHGWGALKDKWYARGFTDCIYLRGTGNTAFTTAIDNSEQTALGYNTVNSTRPGRPFDVAGCTRDEFATLPTKANGYADKTTDLSLTTNFYYSTISQSDGGSLQTNKAWVQEWARVAKESTAFILEECAAGFLGSHPGHSSIGGNDGVAIKWISSLDEKKNHIATTLDYALAQKIGETTVSDVVFINSLCGYYINATTDNPQSAYPNSLTDGNAAYYSNWGRQTLKFNQLTAASSTAGMCGDIANFATDINSYFYNLLQDVTTNPDFKPGPMGIILMDRVSSNKDDDGSKIPSIIIANNFQHVLPAAPTTLSLRKDQNLEDEDIKAAPAQRGIKAANGEATIVWE